MKKPSEIILKQVVSFWLSHFYLRRIGKFYPDYFNKLINDITDNQTYRKIFKLRYTGDNPLKFEAIACEMNIDVRSVFLYHKMIIDKIISGI